MAQSLAKVLIHLVFSTKGRRPYLQDPALREELHCYLGGVLLQHNCQPIRVGGVEDHVHLFASLSRSLTIADTVKECKRASSNWIKSKAATLRDFSWQNGYSAFSVSFSQLEIVRNYIANQEEHHRKISFQDELRELLNRSEVEFDERFVWD
jgi:putative transposase